MLQAEKKKYYNNQDYKQYNNKENKTGLFNVSGKSLLLYLLFLIIVGLLVVTYINQSLIILELNSSVDNLEEDLLQIQEANSDLNILLAQNSSLSRVDNIARKQLGMVEVDQTKTLVFNKQQQKDITDDSQSTDKFFFAEILDSIWYKLNIVWAGSRNREEIYE